MNSEFWRDILSRDKMCAGTLCCRTKCLGTRHAVALSRVHSVLKLVMSPVRVTWRIAWLLLTQPRRCWHTWRLIQSSSSWRSIHFPKNRGQLTHVDGVYISASTKKHYIPVFLEGCHQFFLNVLWFVFKPFNFCLFQRSGRLIKVLHHQNWLIFRKITYKDGGENSNPKH